MYQLSHYYNEPGIFKNVLYGYSRRHCRISCIGRNIDRRYSIDDHYRANTAPTAAPSIGLVIVGLLAIIGAFLVILIISAFFWKRAFNKLGEKSGNNNFNTAGLLILIGAVLSIVGIGGIISWIAWIFAPWDLTRLNQKHRNLQISPTPRHKPQRLIARKKSSVLTAE